MGRLPDLTPDECVAVFLPRRKYITSEEYRLARYLLKAGWADSGYLIKVINDSKRLL